MKALLNRHHYLHHKIRCDDERRPETQTNLFTKVSLGVHPLKDELVCTLSAVELALLESVLHLLIVYLYGLISRTKRESMLLDLLSGSH